MKNKVCVIGGGNVGTTILYSLVLSDLDLDLFLIDNNEKRGYANCLDLNNCLGNQVKIIHYDEIKDMDYIIIASGVKNLKERNIFLKNSYEMIKEILDNINANSFSGKIIVVSNPNDVLTTYVSNNYSGLVIGTGTSLDNNRLITYLNNKYDNSFIIGEHGNTQVIIGNDDINNEIIDYASKIVEGKSYTNYGVSSCVYNILKNLILNNEKTMFVSTMDKINNVCYSYPIKIVNNQIIRDNIDIKSKMKELNKSINKIKREYEIFITPKIIGIDLDDTLTILQKYMKEEAKKFDKIIHGKGIINKKSYLVGEMYGWSDEKKDEFFKNYRINAIEKAKVRPNVQYVLDTFFKKGYKVIIITARDDLYYKNAYEYTKNWLDKNNIKYSELITNVKDKKAVCKKYKVDYFIDDMPNNCEDVNSLGSIKVIMIKNGQNKTKNQDILIVDNFLKIKEVITNE